jgi:DDE superfamily endonuclease
MVLCWEEHTLTRILTALGLESRWRVLEHFAAYGTWDREVVERHLLRLIGQKQPARWGRDHPAAVDDTKLHRTSKQVWGTCAFHEASACSPYRAETARAHNWLIMGTPLPCRPWTYLPDSARLYCRETRLPAGEPFRTKTALAVELLRQADAESAAPILGVFAGASAVDTVIRPCLEPTLGQRPVTIVTRLQADARLYYPVGPRSRGKGHPAQWGPRVGLLSLAGLSCPLVTGNRAQASPAMLLNRRQSCPAAGLPQAFPYPSGTLHTTQRPGGALWLGGERISWLGASGYATCRPPRI